MMVPSLKDVLLAQRRISPYLKKTQFHSYPHLDEYLGCKAYVKHENHQPTGAFKIRGGINLISQLPTGERERGVITASTGNHGQSIALACKIFKVKANVCVMEGANPDKVAAIKSYGAKIIMEGRDYDEARVNAERLAQLHGYRYIHSGNEPHLISGVGTMALEMVEEGVNLDVVFSPVGAGTNCAGVALVYKGLSPGTKVIAVQAEGAPSVYRSWKSGGLESTSSADTMADGLATRQAFELPLRIMRELVDDFILVSDEEIMGAVRMYVEKCHTISEGAGAAPLAAAIKMKDALAGKRVGLVLSGGNIVYQDLLKCLKT